MNAIQSIMPMTKEQLLAESKSLSSDDKVWLAEFLWLDADERSKDRIWDEQTVELRRRFEIIDREGIQVSGREVEEVLAELRQKREKPERSGA